MKIDVVDRHASVQHQKNNMSKKKKKEGDDNIYLRKRDC